MKTLKKMLGISLITLSLFSFKEVQTSLSNKNNLEYACKYGQCHATAKSTGLRCRHCVSNSGDSYCWQHK